MGIFLVLHTTLSISNIKSGKSDKIKSLTVDLLLIIR